MTIKSLVHNLKTLKFDEVKHGKGDIKVNEKLFSRGAINNDKALVYICLFLFDKIDRLRVKRELLPNLQTRTCANRQIFFSRVYKWLDEISKKTNLFRGVPLRRSEFSSYHGVNLIKIMVAFSTYVLKNKNEHKDAEKVLALPKPAIQNRIVQENRSFILSTETSNTYASKATNAAREISTELLSSPPSPHSPPAHLIFPKESRSIECLNDQYGGILQNLDTTERNSVNQESNVVEEPLASASYDQLTTLKRSSSSISFESLRALEESSTSMPIGQSRTVEETPRIVEEAPRTVEETPSSATTEYPETIHEPTNTVPVEYPSAVENPPSPVILDHPEAMSVPPSSLFAEQPRYMEDSISSVYAEEPNTVVTSPNTALLSAAAAAPSATAEVSSPNSATTAPNSPEVGTTEPEVPNISLRDNSPSDMENIYMPNGSRMITTPNYIPRPLTPDQQLDVPDLYRNVSRPKPRATMLNTTFTSNHTSFMLRDTINHFPLPNVLAPMHFNYMTESLQLPPIRNNIQTYLWDPPMESHYWYLPPILQADSHQSPSVNAGSASPPSPYAKRKFEEDDQDSVVVPRSPPRQKRRITYGDQDEAVMTPTSYDMDLVPPLMDEAAPFRRIYNTEYFDIDFMTPRR